MWEGMNQRRFPRVNYRCLVRLKSRNPAATLSATTENIGLGGICVLLDRGLDIFSAVEVDLALEDGKQAMALQGTVVWVVQRHELKKKPCFDTGIEFVDISGEQKARIEAILDKIAPHPAS